MIGAVEALLIEDNPGDAELVREFLGDCPLVHFRLARAATLAEALDSAGGGPAGS